MRDGHPYTEEYWHHLETCKRCEELGDVMDCPEQAALFERYRAYVATKVFMREFEKKYPPEDKP